MFRYLGQLFRKSTIIVFRVNGKLILALTLSASHVRTDDCTPDPNRLVNEE